MVSDVRQLFSQHGLSRASVWPGATWIISFLLLVNLAPSVEAKGTFLYRYRNTEGNVVVGYQVPVEYTGKGYEVLNGKGIVIKVVPRELSDEERLVKDAEEQQEIAAEEEMERRRQWDESLMLRYSTVADIEAAKERALRDLQIRLSILKGNRRALKQRVENFQAQAADTERTGRTVDVERLRAIETMQNEIRATDRYIADRENEIKELAGKYQKDIDRFEELLEVVELRRTLSLQKGK